MTESPWKDGEAMREKAWAKSSESLAAAMSENLAGYEAISRDLMLVLHQKMQERNVPRSGLHRLNIICHMLAHDELIELANAQVHRPDFRPADMNLESLRATTDSLLSIAREWAAYKMEGPNFKRMRDMMAASRRR